MEKVWKSKAVLFLPPCFSDTFNLVSGKNCIFNCRELLLKQTLEWMCSGKSVTIIELVKICIGVARYLFK